MLKCRCRINFQQGQRARQRHAMMNNFTPRAQQVLALARKEAERFNHNYVGTEHLVARTDQTWRRRSSQCAAEDGARSGDHLQEGGEACRSALRAFGRDLTELAKKGELDPVIGRKNEIERVIQILCRRTKNNPVLVGEAGVGKTAIVEGLAQETAVGNVPELLRDKRVITLDLALMVAGTKYRGQFEERIKAVMDEIR